jgi:uncharacterized protein YidB (DUF937 family)
MSLLNSILGAAAGNLLGGGQQQAQNPLLGAAMALLSNGGNTNPGGISGLLGMFQNAGMGNLLQSWIGKGGNLPISAEQLQQVLGNDTVNQLAQQFGIDPSQLSGQLAEVLPQMVDQMTPDGEAPQSGFGGADQIMGLLGGLLKR